MELGRTSLEDEYTNEIEEVGVLEVRVGVVCGEGGVVLEIVVVPDPGIEITDAVSVIEEAWSSSVRVDCPTGVKALGSLFCSCLERG